MSTVSASTKIDVLVVGGGSAALCAAIAARRHGATVRLVEHAPLSLRGGNTRHARNFRLMHDTAHCYVPDSYGEDAFMNDLHRVTRGATDATLARVLIRGSATIAPWLQANGVALQDPGCGVMPYSQRTAFFLGGGKTMINALYATAARIGIEICYDSEVVALPTSDGQGGNVVIDRGGITELVSPKALVLCCGGHQSDRAWLRDSFGDAADGLVVRGTPYATGRVLRMLLDAGARPVGDPSQGHIVAVDARGPPVDGGIVTRITAIPSGIVVDRNAQRFHDEGEDARKTHYARWGERIAQCPGQIAYLIMDAHGRARALPTALPPIEADSIAALAVKLGLDPAALEATTRGFNAAIAGGELIQRRTAQLAPAKSHGAVALAVPPFAAYPMRPGLTFTHFGVAVDPQMRVIKSDGSRFENIFAAGMIMAANVLGRGYLAGLGVTLSAVFGRLAGEEAARHAAR
ncbi:MULTISPECIES: FAD-dependent tricarballylate dehydrogenase TcuA [Rhodopseudomonas]|uniref:Tricarballylate dehydrogenase n=1 Tax=Rhodopseudomonas palustris TaxID=1076 RepID=A0A0D7F409_RHOPL|nr:MULTISPECIES: FAD-dependent tricarballylate dehydrogenase TcuA [Rhodopseudomonas]KIZ46492.1 tricarballylate dehydrogenase [Rhodopseudomonas palustris]MDF3814478.1 FAD-dependent tricarballylate dehydrogenase TcuA [Rhodopseudomonas sp. BAL398]WOK18860.1 FAD-dependent tricarballylate dehydrogenase TcuA [Rhodopseudomonas sp. BAL398]